MNENALVGMEHGLSIMYNLIMSMYDNVSVESDEGKGATFIVCIQLGRYVVRKQVRVGGVFRAYLTGI